ncbi:MAG: heme lyase CcmF/NrfE family subunit [Dongiaceae bacterium]
MIIEVGHFCLLLALVAAFWQAVIPGGFFLILRYRLIIHAALAQFLLISLAFLILMGAHIKGDFSVLHVAENGHSLIPLLYKITGVWGNHEGSMLLWVWVLALFGALFAITTPFENVRLRMRTLRIFGWLGAGFLLFIIATSNPFLRIWPPVLEALELNPLLQDPGLAFHPPLLYLGYVGFAASFAVALGALSLGKKAGNWASIMRPWVTLAWAFLTAGLTLGSWWAYYELGWGGWWFWDPVENAALMPWLLGTALLHSVIVTEKRKALNSWTLLLAILTFAFSLLGTFLVRSGILISVHAFANDPWRGMYILLLIALALIIAFGLYAKRAPYLASFPSSFTLLSREGAMLINNLFLSTGAAIVAIGTLYPLILPIFSGEKISVGQPYFEFTFVPLMIPLLLAMGIAPLLAWGKTPASHIQKNLRLMMIASLALPALLMLDDRYRGLALIGIALALWVIAGALIKKRPYPMTIAHVGLGIAVLGMIASSAWQQQKTLTLEPKQMAQLAGYSLRLQEVGEVEGPNYLAERAIIEVTRAGSPVTRLTPERRFFPASKRWTTEAAIYTNGFADLYVTLGEQDGKNQRWSFRLYHNPLAPWIWVGMLIAAIGGLLGLRVMS